MKAQAGTRARDNHVKVGSIPSAPLRVSSWRCYSEYMFQKINGEVINQTHQSISGLMAVASYSTSSGQIVKSDQAMV